MAEAREQKKAAIESRIAELEAQERRRRRLERELQELLQEGDIRTARKRQASGSSSPEGGGSRPEDTPEGKDGALAVTNRAGRKAPRFRDLPTFNGKSLKEAQAFVAGAVLARRHGPRPGRLGPLDRPLFP